MSSLSPLVVFCLVIPLASCSKAKQQDAPDITTATERSLPPVPKAAPAPVLAPAPSAVSAAAQKVEFTIGTVGNTMAFDKTTLTVPTGSTVHVIVKNAEPGMLPHNWVLVKPGREASVAAAGIPKGLEGNYVDPGVDVLAYTPLAEPGKQSDVTFSAPAPGSYPYICTFPGHYLMMKGVLSVTP